MGKKITVECSQSENPQFVVGQLYDAEISIPELQAFCIVCNDMIHSELSEEIEFENGMYDEFYKVTFFTDTKVFEEEEQSFELVLQMSETGIMCNAKRLKTMLPDKLKPYNYIVTINNYADAKEDRKKLNNLYDTLQVKRKQFEEVELADWKTHKTILMDMEKMIKEASDTLGNGIKFIDENEKLEKMSEVKKSYDIVSQSMPLEIAFETLYDRKKYDPKSMTIKKIEEDITEKVKKIVQEWEMLSAYLPTDQTDIEQVKRLYASTLDVAVAKSKADDLKTIREEVEQANVEASKPEKISPQVPQTCDREQSAIQQLPKQKITVEFIADRPFYDAMNKLILEYKPQVKILNKEEI